VTSAQLNQVNTSTQNNQTSPLPLRFEVSQNPLANFAICTMRAIEMFTSLISPQLNQVNTPTQNKQITLTPSSFEVSQTPQENSPICGSPTIEMS